MDFFRIYGFRVFFAHLPDFDQLSPVMVMAIYQIFDIDAVKVLHFYKIYYKKKSDLYRDADELWGNTGVVTLKT